MSTTNLLPLPAAQPLANEGAIDREALKNNTEKAHYDRLAALNLVAVGSKIQTHKGRKVKTVVFDKKKKDKGDIGRIPKVLAYGLAGVVTSALTLGFINLSEDYRKATWGNVKKAASSSESLIGKRTTDFVLGVAGTIGTFGIAPAVDALSGGKTGFLDNTFKSAFDMNQRTLYFQADEQPEDLSRLQHIKKDGTIVSYDPKFSTTIQVYVKALIDDRSPDVRELDDGSIVVLEKRRDGISSFLLIPKGDWTNARSMKFWNAKTGEAITDPGDAWRAINTYLAGRPDIEQELDKRADKQAKARAEEQGITDEERIQELRASIRKTYDTKIVKVSAKNHRWRLASDDPNDPDKNRSVCGEFSEGAGKTIDAIYKKGEHKLNLKGEQPYKKQPDPPPQEVDLPT